MAIIVEGFWEVLTVQRTRITSTEDLTRCDGQNFVLLGPEHWQKLCE